MKKLIIGIVVLAVIAGGVYMVIGRGRASATASQATPEAAPVLPAVEAGNEVVADAVVVPVRHVALSLPAGGIVAEVPVAEGDRVEAGQLLVRLSAAQQAATVAQAQANLKAAEAQLARTQAGATAEEVAAVEAALAGTKAQLAKAQAGATAEEVAAAEAAVEVARAGLQTAEGAVASARANLARVQAGATQEEVAIAQRQVEQAKNALWGAQTQRDSICGQVGAYAQQSDCDNAKAGVQSAEEAVRIAALQLQQIERGARQEDIAAAQAQLQQALGQWATAQAQVEQAEAELARAKKGASAEDIAIAQAQVEQAEAELARVKKGASAEDVAIGRAQVEQARAALEGAQVALADAELRAPFAGTVAALDVKVGEQVAPGAPIARLADLSAWQIETDDLTELGVVEVSVGDPVSITFDAIPDLELAGEVVRIEAIGENKHGDITYTVIIEPDKQDKRLRWNMTASVTIEPK